MVHIMALFPIMQHDTSSTREQRLKSIQEHFKGVDDHRMPYTVVAIVVKTPEQE
jgi:hypothetical protein